MGSGRLQSIQEDLSPAVMGVYGSHQHKWTLEGGKGLHQD